MDKIIKIIKELLQKEFSGGAKFLDVLPFLLDTIDEEQLEEIFLNPTCIIDHLKKSKDIRVLTYYCDMNGVVLKEKYFVYLNQGFKKPKKGK